MAQPPEDLLRRLYESPPDGFVAARDEAVAAARAAGDRDAAKAIAALRKPTVAAWLVNLLALRRPELVDELVDLAAALRAAQRGLHGAELRELSARRRTAVSALVAQARKLAVEVDPGAAGKLPLADVEATLTAALADTDVAEQVRSGRLIRSVEYAGFGEVPRPKLRLITGGDDVDDRDGDGAGQADEAGAGAGRPGARPRVADPGGRAGSAKNRAARSTDAARAASPADAERAAGDRTAPERARERQAAAERRALERELTKARAGTERAGADLERAEAAERDAGTALDEIEAALIELERRRAAAQAELSQAKLARRSAQREVTVARRRLGEVQAAIESLDDEPPTGGGSPRSRSRKAESGT